MPRMSDSRRPDRDDNDDTKPQDIDTQRLRLARKIMRLIADQQRWWQGCEHAMCRRSRRCFAPDIECAAAPPLPPEDDVPPQIAARRDARMRRRLLDDMQAARAFHERRAAETAAAAPAAPELPKR
ncbi:MAG: hypothetical protein JSR72_18845 [Proteobacteria bacterium]|nr:hypothetical protein [Pseudomonadota bacterium]